VWGSGARWFDLTGGSADVLRGVELRCAGRRRFLRPTFDTMMGPFSMKLDDLKPCQPEPVDSGEV